MDLSGTLAKTLITTNCIESMISNTRCTTGQVTKWKDGSMKKQWIAAGSAKPSARFDGYGVTRT
jgi:hypothetical protein